MYDISNDIKNSTRTAVSRTGAVLVYRVVLYIKVYLTEYRGCTVMTGSESSLPSAVHFFHTFFPPCRSCTDKTFYVYLLISEYKYSVRNGKSQGLWGKCNVLLRNFQQGLAKKRHACSCVPLNVIQQMQTAVQLPEGGSAKSRRSTASLMMLS